MPLYLDRVAKAAGCFNRFELDSSRGANVTLIITDSFAVLVFVPLRIPTQTAVSSLRLPLISTTDYIYNAYKVHDECQYQIQLRIHRFATVGAHSKWTQFPRSFQLSDPCILEEIKGSDPVFGRVVVTVLTKKTNPS